MVKENSGGKVLVAVAVERVVRAAVLVTVGVVLLGHSHTDWQQSLRDLAERAGLDPSRNSIARLLNKAGGLRGPHLRRDGAIATGYGLLEAVEAYGLLRHRRWGEYLTVISTVLLFIPEVDELLHRATPLKIAALVLNVAVVVYLLIRLRRTHGK